MPTTKITVHSWTPPTCPRCGPGGGGVRVGFLRLTRRGVVHGPIVCVGCGWIIRFATPSRLAQFLARVRPWLRIKPRPKPYRYPFIEDNDDDDADDWYDSRTGGDSEDAA